MTAMNLVIVGDDHDQELNIREAFAFFGYNHLGIHFIEEEKTLNALHADNIHLMLFAQPSFDALAQWFNAKERHGINSPFVVAIESPELFCLTGAESIHTKLIRYGVTDVILAHNYYHLAAIYHREVHAISMVNENRNLLEQLKASSLREESLRSTTQAATAYVKDGIHVFVNPAYAKLFGFKNPDDLLSVPLLDLVAPASILSLKQILKYSQKQDLQTSEIESSFKGTKGEFSARVKLAPSVFDDEVCLQIVILPSSADAHINKTQVLPAVDSMLIDPVTGLSNKTALIHHLHEKIKSGAIIKKHPALMIFSIENLPHVLTTAGIEAEHDMVRQFINAAKTWLEETPSVQQYAINDHQFIYLFENTSSTDLVALAEQIFIVVQTKRFSFKSYSFALAINIAVVEISDFVSAEHILLTTLDTLNQAHQKSHEHFQLAIRKAVPLESNNPTDIRDKIAEALTERRFSLQYQSLYDTQDEDAQFFEVFTRLPVLGQQLTPQQFVEYYAIFGLENNTDAWTALNACKTIQKYWENSPNTKLLINLTEEAFHSKTLPDLFEKIAHVLGLRQTHKIILQFDAEALTTYIDVAADVVKKLHNMGFNIGVSHFDIDAMFLFDSYTISTVKLSRSLTHDVFSEEKSEEMQAIIQQLNDKHVNVIVSYIDSPSSMSRAWSMGARYLQGYFLSPLSEEIGLKANA